MGSIGMYQYEPLREHDSIRLFHLLPSTDNNSDIHGQIVETTLSEETVHMDLPNSYPSEATDHFCGEPFHPSAAYSFNGGYTALSYTWGSPEQNSTIFINGKQLGITKNLEQALRSLRLEEKTPRLWVDSICINQSDTKERNSQVQKMCSIYKTATSTLIYLGPSTELSTRCLNSAAAGPGPDDYEPDEFTYRQKPSPGTIAALKKSRDEILGRTWFTRAWTFQELVVSRHPWMCCGTTCLPWSQLCTYFLQKRRWNIKIGMDDFRRETMFSNTRMYDPWGLEDAVSGRYSIIRDPESDKLQITPKGTRVMDKVRQIYHYTGSKEELNDILISCTDDRYTLFTLLEHRQGFAATDPRDAVFSLYGVMDPNDPAILATPVDYEKSTAQIFTDLASAFLSSDEKHGYALLTHVENDHDSIEDLPSWVPNFAAARKYDQSIRSHIIERSYCPSIQKQNPDLRIYKDLNVIVCRGHRSSPKITHISDSIKDANIWKRNEGRISKQGDKSLVIGFKRKRDSEDVEYGDVKIDGYGENGVGRLLFEGATCLQGRRIALLNDGRVALVPEGTEDGDVICVLIGGSVPFVFRKRDKEDESDRIIDLDERVLRDFEGKVLNVKHCVLIGQCWTTGYQSVVEDSDGHDTDFALW